MKQPSNNIDKVFHDRFSNMETPMTEVDELWSRIEKKDRKKRFLPFFFYGIGIIGLLFLGFYFIGGDSIDKQISEKGISQVEEQLNTELSHRRLGEETENEKVIEEKKSRELLVSEKVNEETVLKLEEQEISTRKIIEHIVNQNRITTSTSTISQKHKVQKALPAKNELDNSITQARSIFADSKNSTDGLYRKSNAIERMGKNHEGKEVDALIFQPISPMVLDYPLIQEQRSLPVVSSVLTNFNEEMIEPQHKAKSKFYLTLASGVSLPKDHFSVPVINGESDRRGKLYNDLWAQHFTPLSSFTFSSTLGYDLNRKFSLFIGAEYNHTEIQFEQNKLETNRTIAYNAMAFFEEGDDEIIFHGSDVYALELTFLSEFSKVAETQISIPLGIAYKIYDNNKISLGIESAFILNLSRSYSGQFLDQDLQLVLVEDSNSLDYLESRSGPAYDLAINFAYELFSDLHLFVNPKYRYGSVRYFSDVDYIKMHRSFLGGQLGLRKDF